MNRTVMVPMGHRWAVAVLLSGLVLVPISGWGQRATNSRQKASPAANAVQAKHVPTMAEVAETTGTRMSSPDEALTALKEGNTRFFSKEEHREPLSIQARRAQVLGQTPFAVVLGCSDSRVPIEIVFDQGPGDIFSIRVAGNIASPATLGSVEYAVEHLASRVIVVLGHEACGAVVAALQPIEKVGEAENVRYLVEQIQPALKGLAPIRDKKARLREAVVANVRWQMAELKKNPIVAQAIADGKIRLVGAFYDISSGMVDFLETEEELRVDAPADRQDAS